MLTILYGSDWTEIRNEILRRIARDVRQEQGNRILIVPELISHDAERRLAAAAGDTASRFAQVLSFTRLGRRVMDLAGNTAQECLDGSGRIVAMAAAARQLHSRLKAYAKVETRPEFLSQMVDAVDEFKRCCISWEDLREASRQTQGVLAQKLEELSLLLEAYDALCAQGKRDPRDQMSWVLEQLQDLDFAETHTFYVDGFPDFTRQNMAILEHIIASDTDVTVSLNCDSIQSRQLAFETAGRTAAALLRFADSKGIAVRTERIAAREDALAAVREHLFQGPTRFQPQLQHRLQVRRAGSVSRECQCAAARVQELVHGGCRYRDVAIVCTRPEAYLPALRLVFGRAGIPLYLGGTEQVLASGVISTVIFALEAALGGFEKQDVLRYLRSTLSPLEPDACDHMENYAYIWAGSGLGWTREWTGHPLGLSEQWDEESHRALAALNRDRQRVMVPLIRLRDGFRNSTAISGQIRAIYDFLEEIRFPQRLELLADTLDAQADNRSAQICNQLWEILLSALEQMYDVLGQTAWDDESFTRLLKLLLSQCDVGTIPPVLDAVTVGNVDAMRLQQQKHLIVLGAEEGSLPAYSGSAGVLTDQERVTLRSVGVPLTGGALEGLQSEFAEIYGVFCGAEETVTVLYSGEQSSYICRRLADLSGGEIDSDADPTADLNNELAAAAFLVRHHAADAARLLGIEKAYDRIKRHSGHRLGPVRRENVLALYGGKLRLSASQIDRQAECRLSYFLKYGLRVRERKEAAVDPAEFGTFVHAVLEQTGRAVMEQGGFHAVSLEQTLTLAGDFAESYLHTHFGALESQRLEYLFLRNLQELEAVVRELWRELSQAEYVPAHFELQFDKGGQMPAVDIPNGGMEARLRGFVDRVDIWQRGESSYFRVVDYKTGRKDFDYCDVYNGVGLQMLLYLFALEQAGDAVLPGRRVSAGVQYFPARAPYVSVDGSRGDEEAIQARKAFWKRSGLLLADADSLHAMDPSEKMDSLCCTARKDGSLSGDIADRAQLGILRDYIMKVLGRMAEDIASGNVAPNPYTRGTSHDACAFCPYGGVCHEETVEGRRNYKAMTAQRFWEEIGKEMDTHG